MTNPEKASIAEDTHAQNQDASWGAQVIDSMISTVQKPLLGAQQLLANAPAVGNDTGRSSGSADMVGHLTGTGLLYGGLTLAARYAMGPYARFAAPLVGGGLGFLEPLKVGEGTGTRIENAFSSSIMNTAMFGASKYAFNSYTPHSTAELVPGELTKDWVKVGNQWRPFGVRTPENWDPTKPAKMIVAADSSLIASDLLTSKGYLNGMDSVNGLKEAANDFNAFVLYPIPKPRYGGLFRSWNTPDGAISMFETRSHNDSDYLKAAMDKMIGRANIDTKEIAAFGYDHGGTLLQYQMGVAPEATFNAVGVNASTVSPRIPLPKPGTPIQVGHSIGNPELGTRGDPTLGWDGSRGGVAAIPEKIGFNNLLDHDPKLQATRVAEANGVTTTPEWLPGNADYRVRTWLGNDGKPVAQEIGYYDDFHGVSGRKVGGANESLTSSKNLQGAPPKTSAIETFLDFAGWKKVGDPAALI